MNVIQTNIYKKPTISSTFLAKLEELDAVRSLSIGLCSLDELKDPKIIYDLQLVINEIFCNIVEHGYADNSEGIIKIKATREPDGISFDFYDQGISYVPTVVPGPILNETADRGFGLFIVKELVDHVSYTSKKGDKGWNHLHVLKKF